MEEDEMEMSQEIDLSEPKNAEGISNFMAQLFQIVDPTVDKIPEADRKFRSKRPLRNGDRDFRGLSQSRKRYHKKKNHNQTGGVWPPGFGQHAAPKCGEYTPQDIADLKANIKAKYAYVKEKSKYATSYLSSFFSQVKPIYNVASEASFSNKYAYNTLRILSIIGDRHNLEPTDGPLSNVAQIFIRMFPDYQVPMYDNKGNEDFTRQTDYDIPLNSFTFNKDLRKAALPKPMEEYTAEEAEADPNIFNQAPLVMIVTAERMEHAIIFIIHCNVLYTAGFGYYGKEDSKLERNVSSNAFTHNFESMIGAIYSADYLRPQSNHKCQIVWVGLLDANMCYNMEVYLKDAKTIRPKFVLDETKKNVFISSDTVLQLQSAPYCQLANFAPFRGKQMNCLKWAVTMLNANIYCGASPAKVGIISKPSTCRQVSEDQINTIFNMWTHNNRGLFNILKDVQGKLSAGIPFMSQAFATLQCIRGNSLRQGGTRKTKRKAKRTRRTRRKALPFR